MPLAFILMMCLLGIGIAMFRRNPRAFLNGPTEDAPLRLLRGATNLLAPQRAEWGQAMLGELDHLDGRVRRMRFALGCVVAALVLPPWGRAAAGAGLVLAIALGGAGLYVSVAVRYGLGAGEWIEAAILLVLLIWFVLGASALVRRPGVAVPGLLGGLVVAGVWLAVHGFTFLGILGTIPSAGQKLLVEVGVPVAVGVAGTLLARGSVTGRRIARLAAISGGLGLFLYQTIAVAVIGGGGPYDGDGGGTLRGTISDRLGNNTIDLVMITLLTATVGWVGAAAAGRLLRRPPASTIPIAPAGFQKEM